ncbi:MAG: TIGR03564 family F420-dependent LLM class oxidoreductase [Chloroflexi bacterium]|nr:TIGR03564 family F420-dependent LLM class oxidoreductase [Chloroflexota bacterium]
MKIGITAGLGARTETTIAGLAARAREIEAHGFAGMWMPTAFGFDGITALVAAGLGTPALELGTAVIPTFPRHPVALAQQALTAQAALGGRFTLGIGLSHKVMMEDALGLPYVHPAKHMREYLAVLAPLLRGDPASFHGELYNVEAAVTIAGTAPVPLIIAALGPAMLKLAGTHADGTITSWVGPRTLERQIVPGITRAADGASRPAPRIIAGLPIALLANPAEARERLAVQAGWYNTLPSYRAMFDAEGVAGPAELAILGDERALDAGLRRLEEAGATDFLAQLVLPDSAANARTLDYLAHRAR